MAFIVHAAKGRLAPAICEDAVGIWDASLRQDDPAISALALHRLDVESEAKLAMLGIANRLDARDWLTLPNVSPSLCLSILLLQHLEPIEALPLQLWDRLNRADPNVGLPSATARRIAQGYPIAKWMKAISGRRLTAPDPPTAHLGGWIRGKDLHAVISLLRPVGTCPDHDRLRDWLMRLETGDWVLTNPVW